jgi:CRP-like cAMP-binding protein
MNTSNHNYDVVIKEYEPLETIVLEGTVHDFFYVILSGTVKITQHAKIMRKLREGDVFGAENYYLKRPYTTTAIAITPARIAAYRSEIIHDIFYTNPLMAEQIFTSTMRQLGQTTIKAEKNTPVELTSPIRDHVYHDGEIIIAEGTEGSRLFRLIEAQHGLRVTLQGREIRTVTRPGSFFGEISSLLHQPNSATVTSIGRSRVQVFEIDHLEDDFRRYPELAMALVGSLSNRLQKYIEQDTHQTIPEATDTAVPGSRF